MFDINLKSLDSDEMLISITGYTYPKSDDQWDGNWLNGQTAINIGAFSGRIDILLHGLELSEFAHNIDLFLQRNIDCVKFMPMEPWITFNFAKNAKNNVECKGEITDRIGVGNTLKFCFECEEMTLTTLSSQIKFILEKYPVKYGKAK